MVVINWLPGKVDPLIIFVYFADKYVSTKMILKELNKHFSCFVFICLQPE